MSGQASCRTETARSQRSRRIYALVLALLLVGLCGATYFVDQNSRVFAVQEPGIRSIKIAGKLDHLNRKVLEDTVDGALNGGFFSLDVEAVREATLALPWVADVSVRRVWPHSLHLTVVERRPVARWGAAQLLEASGRRFAPSVDSIPQSLPLFLGPRGSEREMLEAFRGLRPRLAAVGLGIQRIQLSPRRTWSIRLAQGPVVVLDAESFPASVRRFIEVWPEVLAPKTDRIESIDMRYANGFAVRWQEQIVLNGGST